MCFLGTKHKLCPTKLDEVSIDKNNNNNIIIFGSPRLLETSDLASGLMNQITGANSNWRELKPHLWCHTCLETQPSLWSEFKKSLTRALKYPTDHSSQCLVRTHRGFIQKVLASQNVTRPT